MADYENGERVGGRSLLGTAPLVQRKADGKVGGTTQIDLLAHQMVQLRAGASLIDLIPASASPGEAEDGAGRNMDHFAVTVIMEQQ